MDALDKLRTAAEEYMALPVLMEYCPECLCLLNMVPKYIVIDVPPLEVTKDGKKSRFEKILMMICPECANNPNKETIMSTVKELLNGR